MAYYIEEQVRRLVFGTRRPMVNDYFLSTYTTSIYDGCEIGCPYCDGWSFQQRPFNEAVRVPLNMPERAAAELASMARGDLVGLVALTDPYQPAEATYRITRQTLQVLADYGQPTLILTKSPAILEDLPLLERINRQSLAIVMFTILTVDPYLSEKLEDKAPPPNRRLDAIAELKQAGIPTGVALIPVLPYVNDTDLMLDSTLTAVSASGADFVVWDYLHIADERHRMRIGEILARIGRYPPSYYRDLYQKEALPDLRYRQERDKSILERCDSLNLPVRVPHHVYAGKLAPQNEAALFLRHTAFRDSIRGRVQIAQQNRQLAEAIFLGTATEQEIHASPLVTTLQQILGKK